MANCPAPGGGVVGAFRLMVGLEPSGRVRLNWMVSPAFGFEPSATEIVGGEPEGPLTAAPVNVEFTLDNWKPNGEPSWLNVTFAPLPPTVSRPRPLVPRSACSRSLMTCVSPACEPLPLRIAFMLATAGWFTALPENR